MNIPFLDKWRRGRRAAATPASEGFSAVLEDDPHGAAELFSECALLRSHAAAAGLDLDDSVASLTALDQLLPRWRDDPETLPWLGNDAGLYLGTVIVRTVPGAVWQVWPAGHAVVRLASGREIPVVEAGGDWAAHGSPELCRVYADAAEA